MRTSLAAFSDAFSVGLRDATASSTRASASANVTGSSGAPRRWMRGLGTRPRRLFEVENLLGQARGDPLARAAVPELGNLAGAALAVQSGVRGRKHVLAPRTRDDVRPLLDGDGTLGRLPEGDAGNAEHGRLLLHPTRVG